MKRLLIVESPTKARTLQSFLGKDYNVQSSFGHVRDLPKSKLGVDVEKNFEPTYVIPTKAKKTISALKKEVGKANEVILASVDYAEPALIQYPNAMVHMVRVGEFIDWLLESNISPSQFRVAAFDFRSHRISLKRIKDVVRHPIKERLLKITTDYGRTITVTASHSLFQKDQGGKIYTVAGKNLKRGDSLLIPIRIPRGVKDLSAQKVDVLEAIYEDADLRAKTFIKSPTIAEYRTSQLLAPRKGKAPQFAPRLFFTDALRNTLYKRRLRLGWSQKTLAQNIGCSQSDIARWESGKGNPTLVRGKQYVQLLDMRFEELIRRGSLSVGLSSIEQVIAQALKTQWNDSRKSKARSWQPLTWFGWEELKSHFADDETIEISRSNHSHRMPRFIPIDSDLMLFLGFFTAEGSFLTQGKYTRFSFGPRTIGAEQTHIDNIKKISQRLFNLSPSDFGQRTSHSVVLNSTLVTFFLKKAMGIKNGAGYKEVPDLIFNVSQELQYAFLRGCFLGDGTLGKGGITFNTISPTLAYGISFLLLQNGIFSTHSLAISKKLNRKPVHQITITGKEKLIATLPIWEEHYKAHQLKEYCERSRNFKANFSLAKNQKGDLALLRVKKIEATKPYGSYVYDFSVEGENFICGDGGVCAHNTDEDREGESIAWHLTKALDLENPERIVFHEITKQAIEEALQSPRRIDMDLVDAQQARRVLDRLVGYKLSPFLWKKVASKLSAGRVQSVAVRLVVDREREIEKFKSQEYWSIEALLRKIQNSNDQNEFTATIAKKDEKPIGKLDIKNKEQADEILRDLEGAEYRVAQIEKKETRKNPLPPFTTSTLQQTASQRFRFPARLTMSIAQQLYETGLITYHRTDSVNLAQSALTTAKSFIIKEYGQTYWAGSFRQFKTKSKGAQEAHEAIRPTNPSRTPNGIKLQPNQARLYDLIWRRFIASQMSQARFDSTAVEIEARHTPYAIRHTTYAFRATGQVLKFDGFLKVYPMKFEEADLPMLEKGEILDLKELIPSQHFTQPPPRYNEASLIKALESYGIGRPSTYAPILSTIQERNYVEKDEQRRLRPTEIGIAVNDLLVEHFPEVVDVDFTAEMEEDLDKIAEGRKEWVPMIKEFYDPFAKNLEKKYEEVSRQKIAAEETDKQCPECGKPLLIRLGRYGKFYACSGFPECKYTASLEENNLNISCPKCGQGQLTAKRTKRKKIFYGCNRYPSCDFALWDKPTDQKCEKCGSLMVEKGRGTKCSNPACETNRK